MENTQGQPSPPPFEPPAGPPQPNVAPPNFGPTPPPPPSLPSVNPSVTPPQPSPNMPPPPSPGQPQMPPPGQPYYQPNYAGYPGYPGYPAYPGTPTPPPHQPGSSAGVIILQWLTYAFWGWTVLAMSFLTSAVLASFLADSDTGDFTPYAVAAVLVLLPISLACDHFYHKNEPEKKVGGASIVMVIHAVIFALFCIGALIAAVFSVVTMFTSSSDSSGKKVALFSSIIIFLLYASALLRTVNPPRFPKVRRLFMTFMVAVVGIVAILGLVGPVAKSHELKNDKLIEANLDSLSQSITNYASTNNQLPSDLHSLTLTGDTKKLVDENLVTYKANTKTPTLISTGDYYTPDVGQTKPRYTYYYQLCATFKKASKTQPYPDTLTSVDGYSTYADSYYHGSGNTCYKLKTLDY